MLNLKVYPGDNLQESLMAKKARVMLVHPHEILQRVEPIDTDDLFEVMPSSILRDVQAAMEVTRLLGFQLKESLEQARGQLEAVETRLEDDLENMRYMLRDMEDAIPEEDE